jgi:hypothetical protein
MKKLLYPLLIAVVIVFAGLLSARLFLGGDEDTWICTEGQWIKHGNPSAPQPATGCGEKQVSRQTFNEAGLSLTLDIPSDTTFRKEIEDDAGKVRVASFYVEKGPSDNPTYQLYAVYEPLNTVTEKELNRIKTGLSPNSVREITIDGYKGIEGLIEISGPKNHYLSAIVKDGKLFTISTFPPTAENKKITDQIISTIRFK